ncbi:DUF4360 domain-containing protein [Actinomadura sp. 9N215]|uniref:DUF4360 domain-containing protein n=1 Tax=Actinomadura sp. 9N215 TaxID=3375150 RepID=UPI00378D1D37
MRKGFAIPVAVALAIAVAPGAAASEQLLGRGPDGVTIEVVTLNGSGCLRGTAAAALSETSEAFKVTYAKYLAQAGGVFEPTDALKNCQITLRVNVPLGFSFAISSAEYRGYASLPSGASATLRASYHFHGDPRIRESVHSLSGPYKKNWQFVDVMDVPQFVWSRCGERTSIIYVNTELRVDPGSSDPSKVGHIGMDSADGSIKTTYHYSWRHCL